MGLKWKQFVEFEKDVLDIVQLALVKLEGIKRAERKYEKNIPMVGKTDFSECFTFYQNYLLFWFNSEEKKARQAKYDILVGSGFD